MTDMVLDADIAEHHRPDDDGNLVPRSAMNFVLMELQKLRNLTKPQEAAPAAPVAPPVA